MTDPVVRLNAVTKRFADVVAVDRVDLEVVDGEFLTLLGPSGSGKTTALRLIAGFEAPTSGTVEIAGRDVTDDPPYLRDVNTVFQDYALFPHMTVAENIEYGLRVRGTARAERESATTAALQMVQLPGHGSRKPGQLSGGQRQRVALARALVNRPRVLLLDEPLGALDLKLRRQMQVELKSMQRELGITFIFVTHDQEEALAMSDRIAVFNAGRIEQLGTAQQVYEQPATGFVAGFIGTMNLLDLGGGRRACVRPERIEVTTQPPPGVVPGPHGRLGSVADVVYLGASRSVMVRCDDGAALTAAVPSHGQGPQLQPGQRVWCAWEPQSEFIIN